MMTFRFCHVAAVAAVGLSMGNTSAFAATADSFDPPSTLSGSYLAGRSADGENDVDAALAYLGFTLKADPGNAFLSERVLMLQLAAGEIEDSFRIAERLIISENRNPSARMALAVSSIKRGRYDLALKELKETANSPLATLTAGLLGAWALQGRGETDAALKQVDDLTGPSWYNVFKEYHRALIADAAGRKDIAEKTISRAYESDGTALRIVEAYARIKTRNGKKDEALVALNDYFKRQIEHPVAKQLLAEIESGKTPAPIAATPQAGAAEVLYGLGSAIGTDEGASLAAAYLQLAHYLQPDLGPAVVTLGDIFQSVGQCEKAIDIYGRVADSSPLFRNVAIQTSTCLDTLGRTDEAAKEIRKLIEADPKDVEAALALGNLYRNHERFAEAADAFTIGVKAIDKESEADWRLYYSRGVSYERTQRWPQAEADFKRALKLNPNQPQVLNYLGYSWVDKGINLDEALGMIQEAVDLRPNDGYIVDSLGWAYYKLARYDDAVEQLERAIELRAEDPVLNDHLGDAYWQVGRKREATFQWAHARDLKPASPDLAKILDKLQNGLETGNAEDKPSPTPAATPAVPVTPAKTTVAAATPIEPKPVAAPSSVTVQIGDSLASIAERVYGDRELYLKIYEANKDRIANPDVILPGMTLTIPARDLN